MNPEDETAQATASTIQPPDANAETALSAGGGSPAPPLRRGTQVGRFITVDQLGAGSMGEVVLAYDPDLHRRVAVKVLRAGLLATGGTAAVHRMLREARAMAKLSHPNVITVFEVAQMDTGQSFIAMEYVDGGTLRDWSKQPRQWREVVNVYRAAGAGLAAAHGEGLVHRDFKPDNVLIGRDGRVRVTDFGLVGALGERDETDDDLLSAQSGDAGAADVTLTRTGSLLGTPAYMAPEDAKQLDAKSDQFSFCIALYEALYGQRPFSGDSLAELRRNVCTGTRRPPPSDADVPRWLAEAIDRGLEVDPDARWPDMPSLLRALHRQPGRRPRQVAYGLAAVGVVSGALAVAMSRRAPPPPSCDDGSDETRAVWNDARKRSLRSAFTKADPAASAVAIEAVEVAASAFVDDWQAGHLDACEAHMLRNEQSAALFDRRMLCLDRRLEKVDILLSVFEEADATAVQAATRIEGAMPSVKTCADAEALQSLVPPPDAPAVRKEWKQLQLGVDRADALGIAGQQIAALDVYAGLRDRIEAVGHPPLTARYLQNYGNALIRVEKHTEAIELLATAPEAAARADDARLEANVWLLLARAHGYGLNDAKAGAWAARAAEVAAVRARDQPMMQLNIQFTQAILAQNAGDFGQAAASARRAITSAEEVYGRQHRNTSAAWGTLGNALHHLGKLDEARKAHETSLEIDRGLHDGPHPDVAASHLNIGLLDEEVGDFDAARARYEKALAIYEQSVGKEHGAYGTALLNLASNAANRGDFKEAEARYLGVLAFYEATLPEGHADFGTVYVDLAEVALAQGELDEALAQARRGVANRVASYGDAHPKVMLARTTLGRVLLARGAFEDAEAELLAAQRIADATLDPTHTDHIDILVALGEVLIATARGPQARPLLQRAVKLAAEAPPAKLARARAALQHAG
ncbi:MAG: tetratricopeptide repeat protein [Nannocystaceae bacterium]|nr:serine/threonine-protein kinase [bacterium]